MKGSHDSRWGESVRSPLTPLPLDGDEPSSSPRDAEDLGPCAARPMPGGWTGIYILNGRENTRAFQYMHLGLEEFSADGRWFTVEFNVNIGEKWRLTVHGRNLWPIFVNLHHHKLEWIKKADREFGDDDRPLITRIDVEPVLEEEGPAAGGRAASRDGPVIPQALPVSASNAEAREDRRRTGGTK